LLHQQQLLLVLEGLKQTNNVLDKTNTYGENNKQINFNNGKIIPKEIEQDFVK